MPSCMFIGEHDFSKNIYHVLISVIEELITKENVSTFYVGNQGFFDTYAQKALHTVQEIYPDINCFIVLAYLPGKQKPYGLPPLLETIYPEGIEKVPRRYAINHRNRWMLEHSSFIVSAPSGFGNSAKLVAKARLSGKTVIDISDEINKLFPVQ